MAVFADAVRFVDVVAAMIACDDSDDCDDSARRANAQYSCVDVLYSVQFKKVSVAVSAFVVLFFLYSHLI